MEAPAAPRPAPGKRISIALAILMHVVLAIILIYGVHWQTQKPVTVTVDLVSNLPPAPAAAPKPEQAPEPPKPEPKAEPKPEPKPLPKPEPVKPPPKPDIAEKEKPKPEPKKPEPPKPAPDPFKDQLEREMREKALREEIDRDRQARKPTPAAPVTAPAKAPASAVQGDDQSKYIAAIRGKVRGNIVLASDIKGNPEAVFEVTQLPSGEVLNVKLLKSSGNPAWDGATERAIHKSSPLPKPAKPELFERKLELRFRPQED